MFARSVSIRLKSNSVSELTGYLRTKFCRCSESRKASKTN